MGKTTAGRRIVQWRPKCQWSLVLPRPIADAAGDVHVHEPTAAAIRKVFEERGELSAVMELRRHFPGLKDNENARAGLSRHGPLAAIATPA